MKIVAFLQNMWVRDPARVREGIKQHGEEYRRRVMAYSLFAGCLTGRRLKAALGEELCNKIIWEECTREIAGNPLYVPAPQPDHIRQVLQTEKPDVVLAFGKVASNAVSLVVSENPFKCVFLTALHPAARLHQGVLKSLKKLADDLRKLME